MDRETDREEEYGGQMRRKSMERVGTVATRGSHGVEGKAWVGEGRTTVDGWKEADEDEPVPSRDRKMMEKRHRMKRRDRRGDHEREQE